MRSRNLLHVAADDIDALAAQLRHQVTTLGRHSRLGVRRPAGVTVWATETGSATVYWTWVVGDDGYPVLADPMALRSNLLFHRPGQRACFDDQLTSINWLVYRLPWQQEVCKHLGRSQAVVEGGVTRRRAETQHRAAPPARPTAMVAEHAIAA